MDSPRDMIYHAWRHGSGYTWTCRHCGAVIEFTYDPIDVYVHMAWRCLMISEADAIKAHDALIDCVAMPPIKKIELICALVEDVKC